LRRPKLSTKGSSGLGRKRRRTVYSKSWYQSTRRHIADFWNLYQLGCEILNFSTDLRFSAIPHDAKHVFQQNITKHHQKCKILGSTSDAVEYSGLLARYSVSIGK
jgi:hypothetical protein